MKTSRKLIVGGAAVVILGAGFATAPGAAVLNLAEPDPTGQPADMGDGAGSAPDASAGPSASAGASASAVPGASAGASKDGTFPGPVITNIRGDYQLQIVVKGGTVTDVQFLTAGTEAAQSVSVNAMALPILRERILEAQDWDVDYVSGSSYTSPAMVESAQGAFDDAGL